MTSEQQRAEDCNNRNRGFVLLPVAFAALAVLLWEDYLVSAAAFLLVSFTPMDYSSPLYMTYLRRKWEQLPEVEPEPIPELDVNSPDYSRERLLQLSNNLQSVVVLRNALSGSNSVQSWSPDYFLEKYGDEKVVVREMTNLENIRLQRQSLKRFHNMLEDGRNVSIIASSILFADNAELKDDLKASVEKDLVGTNGDGILAHQLFSTPGGRTWYHAAVGSNVFRQIAGQKRWNVISPKHNLYMCAEAVISGTSVNPACLLKMDADERELWVKRIPRQTALLNPGDILINAPWWWHDVQSIGKVGDPQMSVAGRIKSLKESFFNSPVQSVTALITRIRTGNVALSNRAEYDLEDNVIDSWFKECVKRNGDNCHPDP